LGRSGRLKAPPPADVEPVTAVRARSTTLLGSGLIVVLALALRLPGLSAGYWRDETQTMGIASMLPGHLLSAMRMEPAPPLYYLLLHFWMRVFGSSEVSTHSLSMVFSVAAVVVALVLGMRYIGRTAGLALGLLVATSPLLCRYATETRMYSLLGLLSLLLALQLYHFLRTGNGAVWVGVLLALLLYTHSWGVYTSLVVGVLLVVTAVKKPALRRDCAWAIGIPLVAFLPWLPILRDQARQIGAKWAESVSLEDALRGVGHYLGSPGAIGVVIVVVALLMHRRNSGARLAGTLLIAGFAALALAWIGSHVGAAWLDRYMLAVLPLVYVGLATALPAAGRAAAVGVAFVVAGSFAVAAHDAAQRSGRDHDDMKLVSHAIAQVRGQDVFIVAPPEELPEIRFYVHRPATYYSFDGPERHPAVQDWRHAVSKLTAETTPRIEAALARIPAGATLVELPEKDLTNFTAYKTADNAAVDRWHAAIAGNGRFVMRPPVAAPGGTAFNVYDVRGA
jgi:mannosyltransferase